MAATEHRALAPGGGTPTGGVARPSLAEVAAQFPRAALGRSDHLGRLFDYLLDKSQRGEVCREVDILIDIFGKAGADALLDASTRVYVHRLRKKMDEFYAGPGNGQAYRLMVPKGEYRLAVEGRALPPDAEATAVSPSSRWSGGRWRLLIAMLGSAALGAAVILAGQSLWSSRDGLDRARQSHVWAPLLGVRRPLTIVPGDYYIMGEQDEMALAPNRLVRDFSINSRADLERRLIDDPALRNRYIDLDLRYLPTRP
ncbi:hypothetical protein [Sphingobium sp. CAP-1]|uniref:hypothetical protein n=1 Tax=Sphingobium sp. CAP-1 TaxID=2676077 RepID=UPI0012BB455C|nr:hypothetical protein [Sphingobium sp. CAP-1]QGP80436.1 hypothetical protein GL174_14950 [Sphingobium sp. CAP-1]